MLIFRGGGSLTHHSTLEDGMAGTACNCSTSGRRGEGLRAEEQFSRPLKALGAKWSFIRTPLLNNNNNIILMWLVTGILGHHPKKVSKFNPFVGGSTTISESACRNDIFSFAMHCGLLAGCFIAYWLCVPCNPEEQFPVSLLKHPLLRLGNGGAVRDTQEWPRRWR